MIPRIPFFGMLSVRSPMLGLLDHYNRIATGMDLVEKAIRLYITDHLSDLLVPPEIAATETERREKGPDASERTPCSDSAGSTRDFMIFVEEVNKVEEDADQIKRNIRNHLPTGLFLAVDRTLFFNYTRQQDNILDCGQDSLHWLCIRHINIPRDFQSGMLQYVDAVSKTVSLLKPALEAAVAFVNGDSDDREKTKDLCRDVRWQHGTVSKMKRGLDIEIYNADMEFKDINLLMLLTKDLHGMSHNAEGCADMLRAMIAR